FDDPRLRQLFARYATYYGSSPYEAPATLNLIAHVEMNGVWSVAGGMTSLASALADVARDAGAELHTGRPVLRVHTDGARAAGVWVDDRLVTADAVVFNG